MSGWEQCPGSRKDRPTAIVYAADLDPEVPHGRCPVCGQVKRLMDDGRMDGHRRPRPDSMTISPKRHPEAERAERRRRRGRRLAGDDPGY